VTQARLTITQDTAPEGVRVLALAGEIDHTTADTFRHALTAHDGPAPNTVIDLRHVTFMDSSGINVLIAAHQTAHAQGGRLYLTHVPAPVHTVLHIVGLDDLIPIYPTLDQALTAQDAA
jgi:stage II sporulation protein AA (anti-sigma F factor antagonist)